MSTGKIIRTIALNVRVKRMAKHLSQEDFADLCGLHRTYIGAIERAERNVTVMTLEKLAKALECEIHELLQNP